MSTEHLNTYLVRYWKKGDYDGRKQYVVKGNNMENALTQEKNKVFNASDFLWCIDSELITGQFDRILPIA